MGVPYSKFLLYDDEHTAYVKNYPDQFRFDYAVSREATNAARPGGPRACRTVRRRDKVSISIGYHSCAVANCLMEMAERCMRARHGPAALMALRGWPPRSEAQSCCDCPERHGGSP